MPKELPIHSEIYKARPDVTCVVHAHPPEALICGIAELEFRPIFGSFNIPAMRLALEGIPVFGHSYLVTRPDLAKPFIDAMGDKDVCVMRGHGITVTGRSVEDAVVRALNFNTLAKVTLQVAQTGREARAISEEDIAELPDLGQTFNEEWVWRYYERKLKQLERN
ncbi:class II aldolase/adducin family protein [Alicyclobacillus fastidiosus]|uniref:class II aldolase/adducin family protein n=1 Tax=Alicyclobacillus fastidiosus TaxID=392011 RepID=UPI0024E1771F|nr:class II aldolase/adducin family protein [Alicyclobacillus fastidiosus]